MNGSIVIETMAIAYYNAPDTTPPIAFNEQIISQYGIWGFILYLIILFVVSTVGSYIILKRIKEINEQEPKNED